jgi:hypothetical protein
LPRRVVTTCPATSGLRLGQAVTFEFLKESKIKEASVPLGVIQRAPRDSKTDESTGSASIDLAQTSRQNLVQINQFLPYPIIFTLGPLIILLAEDLK